MACFLRRGTQSYTSDKLVLDPHPPASAQDPKSTFKSGATALNNPRISGQTDMEGTKIICDQGERGGVDPSFESRRSILPRSLVRGDIEQIPYRIFYAELQTSQRLGQQPLNDS